MVKYRFILHCLTVQFSIRRIAIQCMVFVERIELSKIALKIENGFLNGIEQEICGTFVD